MEEAAEEEDMAVPVVAEEASLALAAWEDSSAHQTLRAVTT